MVTARLSTHAESHPDQILLEAGDGFGGSEYLTASQARGLARRLDALADTLERRAMARLMTDNGVVV